MFDDSPFAVPVGSFQSPVPVLDLDPGTGTPTTITLDCEWIPYIIGALKQLLLQTTWRTDDPAVLALQQQRVTNLIDLFQCGGTEGEMFNVRVNPFNLCLLEKTIDGGLSWTPFADISQCVTQNGPEPGNPPPGGQPGGYVYTPADGFCHTLNFTVQGNGRTLIPIDLAEGDTIDVVDAVWGAWQDNNVLNFDWFCGNGLSFFLTCVPSTATYDPSDPLPTQPHMTLLLVSPDEQYFDIANLNSFTVPADIPTGNWMLQANDSDLTDNNGSVNVKLQICRNRIAVTMQEGTGPSLVAFNQEYTFVSDDPVDNQRIFFQLSQPAAVSIVSVENYTNVGTCDHTNRWLRWLLSNVESDFFCDTDGTNPLTFPPYTALDQFVMDTAGPSSNVFSITVLFSPV